MPFDGRKEEFEDRVLTNLIKARAMIEDPENWCVGYLNNLVNGKPHQHCAVGAVNVAAKGDWAFGAYAELRALAGVDEGCAAWVKVAMINNEDGHAAVMKLFDDAIERRRATLRAGVAQR